MARKLETKDVESLANSSPFFRNLLLADRSTYLLEKMFPLVASSVCKEEGLHGLPVSEVHRMRGVSPHWNTVIEKLIPEQFQHVGKDVTPFVAEAFETILNPTTFSEAVDPNVYGLVQNFIHRFEEEEPNQGSKERNPFIWGKLQLDIVHFESNEENYELHQRYLQDISTVISKYGRFIQELGFAEFGDTSIFRDWFLSMPFISVLGIHSDSSFRQEEDCDWEFPKLDHLKSLSVCNLPTPFFNSILRQNNQISGLFIEFEVEFLMMTTIFSRFHSHICVH